MALPCPGPAPISLQDIQTELGGSNSISISEYYKGGSIVSQRWYSDTIPTSGPIKFSNFFCITKSTFWMAMYYDSSNLPIPISFASNGTKLYVTTREGLQASKFNMGLFSLDISSNTSFPTLESLSQLSDNSTASNSLFSTKIRLFTANGNMYIGGYRRDAPSGSIYEAFLTKYNSSKIIQWQKLISQTDVFANPITSIDYVSVSNSEEIYASGMFTNNSRNDSIFLNKYDSTGIKLWGIGIYPPGGGSSGTIQATALDSSNNVYIACQIYDSSYASSPLLVKYDSDGVFLWEISFSNEFLFATMNIDSNDNIYTVSINSSVTVAYLRKYDTSGTVIWQKTLPSLFGAVDFARLAFDTSGNIYYWAYKSSTQVALLIKFHTTGTVLWQRQIGGAGSAVRPRDIIVGTNNELYLLAQNNSSSINYIFVAKIPQDGGPSSTYTYNFPFPQYSLNVDSIITSTATVGSSTRSYSTNSISESISAFTSTTRTYPTALSSRL